MRLTDIDNDNKRLLKALVLACGLYVSLAFMAVVVRLPDTRLTANSYGAIRISLAPAVRQDIANVRENELAPARAENVREVSPSATDMPQVLSAFESDFSVEAVRIENPTSGVSPGEQSFLASNAAAVGSYTDGDALAAGPEFSHGQVGQTDPAAAVKARFIAWLDTQIRERLVYPDKARRRNIEGVVTVHLSVPADGSSCDCVVTGGSGSTLLDRAAVDLVRTLFPAGISPGNEFDESIQIAYRLVVD